MKIVYTTCSSLEECRRLAHLLLEKKLIVCATYLPANSSYFWDGKLVDEEEYCVLFKTSEAHVSLVREALLEAHSYDVPCVLTLDADANEAYVSWMSKALS